MTRRVRDYDDHPFPVRHGFLLCDEPQDHSSRIEELRAIASPTREEVMTLKGLVAVQERGADQRRVANRLARIDREVARRARYDALHERGGWPRRILEAAITARTTPALADLRAWLLDDARIVVLSGPTGTGKTTAAVAMAWRQLAPFVETGRPPAMRCRFERSTKLVQSTERGALVQAGIDRRMTTFDHARDADLLIVDDVGVEESQAQHVASFWDEFIDERYTRNVGHLVLTTNLSLGAIRDRFGPRAWRRIEECGGAVQLTVSDAVTPNEAAGAAG